MDPSPRQVPRIAEFYRGRSVLITGGTGFVGKVIIEKLLRSCPDIAKIYIITRAKKGILPLDRIKTILDLPLFNKLNTEQPEARVKVIAVEGDMMELGLGLSPEDRRTLQEQVSVVFNVAANVRFDHPLSKAVIMNVRGTRDVLELASDMKLLKSFVHVSTTFCNTDHTDVHEVVYPCAWNWRNMISVVETVDDLQIRLLTPKILGTRPNTYTFTKALAEQLVEEYATKLPCCVLRPSVVVNMIGEPLPGWIDSFSGPVGLYMGMCKGIIRCLYSKSDAQPDSVPVDLVARAIVVSAWTTGVKTDINGVDVYNCAASADRLIDFGETFSNVLKFSIQNPLDDIVWYPRISFISNFALFYINTILFQLIPAIFLDLSLKVSGKKPIMEKLQRQIYSANLAMNYFMTHTWKFGNSRYREMLGGILPSDEEEWGDAYRKIEDNDSEKYSSIIYFGCKKYVLKEGGSTLLSAQTRLQRMYWLDIAVKFIGAGMFLYLPLQYLRP